MMRRRTAAAGPAALMTLLIVGLATVLGATGSPAAADDTIGIEVTVPGADPNHPTSGAPSPTSGSGDWVTELSTSTVLTTVLAAGGDATGGSHDTGGTVSTSGTPGSDAATGAAAAAGGPGASTNGRAAGIADTGNGSTGGLARTGAPLATLLATALAMIASGTALTALTTRDARPSRRSA